MRMSVEMVDVDEIYWKSAEKNEHDAFGCVFMYIKLSL